MGKVIPCISIGKLSFGTGDERLRGFEHIRALGYGAVDYSALASPPGQALYALGDAAFERFLREDAQRIAACGLIIDQAHGPWPYEDWKPETAALKHEAMIRAIYGASIAGAPYLVLHPVMPSGWRFSPRHEEEKEENIAYMRTLLPYAERWGVVLAVENMPHAGVPCGQVEELAACVDALDSPYAAACLDTGHALCCGCEPADAVRLLGKRIKTLHVHDNDGEKDLHLPPHWGIGDWDAFTAALKAADFSGALNLEAGLPASLPKEARLGGHQMLAAIAIDLAQKAGG